MTVIELINKLYACDPEATVCVEAWMSPEAKVVKEYETEIGKCVYIGDDLDNLDYEMAEDDDEYTPSASNGDYSPSNPWDAPGMSVRDFI
jgi:hypothetical protein